MKVKIGNLIYDGEDQPVMVILSDNDKINISNMHPDATRYACFPKGISKLTVKKFMK